MAVLVAVLRLETWRRLERAPGPVILFKHSTACSQSARAYQAFKAWADGGGAASATLALVRVREEHALSRQIAAETGVRHESPQVLALASGRVVGHLSHAAITAAALDALVARARGA